MNSVGIDISKGRSTIAVMRPFGEVVISPFEVRHTDSELSKLARRLKSLNGETRVVMEATGNYHAPVAKLLHDAGLYVSVVNAKLVHGYGNNDLRRVKTDRKDAVKLANYGLDRWLTLPRYVPEEDTRLLLKNCYRQYRQYSKVQTVLKNNLISLLDTVFPNVNRLFSSPIRGDGSEKWVDLLLNSGIAAALARNPKRSSQTNTSVGAENAATISARKKRTPFTSKPAGTLALCQNPKRQSYSWSRLLLNSERLLLRLLHSNTKCNHWLPCCRNIPLSWICSA